MRTSLNDIKLADDYLYRQLPAGDALLFEANMLLNPALREDVSYLKTTHRLVKQYSRKKLKAEIATVHQQLFTSPAHKSFAQQILNIFR
ncbi:hypothetical protein EOD41_00200 [Mucilaginibacter limnophilus]|uniref:Uncharacterized protein n=1 Tax=Mucilaginibacter limnophilus TaxID=1932778 RepID=A0A3S2UNV8_9SPHI|nr:hypothetical protein [Mucilaginibacter limnophilus]RVU02398.1 hypothetical protein EOD41_00200 [Mucilaginibacter limnophilus]